MRRQFAFKKQIGMHYVYVLQSKDEKKVLYVGYSPDVYKRLAFHNSEKNKGWTRTRKWELVYFEAYRDKRDALTRERKLKQDGRSKTHLRKRIIHSLEGAGKKSAGEAHD